MQWMADDVNESINNRKGFSADWQPNIDTIILFSPLEIYAYRGRMHSMPFMR
jgi:hypothetical protein